MQGPLDRGTQVAHEIPPNSDPVTSEVRALVERVRASISVVESAMMRAATEDLDTAEDFFILDDVTPRYLRLRSLLDAVDAHLSAALHDA
jgi:hypothetical protein